MILYVLIKTYSLIAIGWFIGYISKKGKLISTILARFLIWVLFPLSIMFSVSNATMSDFESSWVVVPLMLLMFICIGISWKYAKDMEKPQKGAIITTSAFSNILFIPLGIFGSLYPEYFSVLTFLAFILTIISNILRAIVSVYYSPKTSSIWEVLGGTLKYPPMIAMIFGFILWFSNIKLGPNSFFSGIKELTTILGLMTVGTGVSTFKPNKNRIKHALFVASLRLGLSPFIAFWIIMIIRPSPLESTFLIIEAGMPPAALNVANARIFEMDTELAATTVLVSTLFLLMTLPVLLYLAPL